MALSGLELERYSGIPGLRRSRQSTGWLRRDLTILGPPCKRKLRFAVRFEGLCLRGSRARPRFRTNLNMSWNLLRPT